MKFSTLTEIDQQKSNVSVFGGYNHNISITDGEFFDCKNLTSDYFPLLSPRGKRGSFLYPNEGEHKITGVICKDSVCYADGDSFYVDGTKVEGITLTDTPKQLVSMGAYIIIMPDKKYINTKDLTDCGDIEDKFTTEGTVTYQMCRIDGTAYTGATVSPTEPSNPKNGDYWIDTSSNPHELKQYSATNSMWVAIATTYIKISAKNIASKFTQMDAVRISGIDKSITQLETLEGQTSILWEVHHDEENEGNGDFIIVVGILDQVASQTAPLMVERLMPNLDFIIESNNRLWGCRYGEDIEGNVVNEIYASKLGDFKNWSFFAGASSDSYTVSCGTDGAWTGAVTHLGYPIFFKENCLHKVYGNFPSNYQVQVTDCRGVQKGAGNSLAIVNESLYYKSRNGVCVYDGSLPREVSNPFGDIHYTALEGDDPLRSGAVAGSHGNKYYISMKSEKDNKWYLFVYDASIGLWHKEDETKVDGFSSLGDEMYFISGNQIKTMFGSGKTDTAHIDWMAETGIVGTTIQSGRYDTPLPGKKYVTQLLVRMSLSLGSIVSFYIQYDSKGEWEHISTHTGTRVESFNTMIRPKRCDHFKIRIVGRGEGKIYSYSKTIERGSDV